MSGVKKEMYLVKHMISDEIFTRIYSDDITRDLLRSIKNHNSYYKSDINIYNLKIYVANSALGFPMTLTILPHPLSSLALGNPTFDEEAIATV